MLHLVKVEHSILLEMPYKVSWPPHFEEQGEKRPCLFTLLHCPKAGNSASSSTCENLKRLLHVGNICTWAASVLEECCRRMLREGSWRAILSSPHSPAVLIQDRKGFFPHPNHKYIWGVFKAGQSASLQVASLFQWKEPYHLYCMTLFTETNLGYLTQAYCMNKVTTQSDRTASS